MATWDHFYHQNEIYSICCNITHLEVWEKKLFLGDTG